MGAGRCGRRIVLSRTRRPTPRPKQRAGTPPTVPPAASLTSTAPTASAPVSSLRSQPCFFLGRLQACFPLWFDAVPLVGIVFSLSAVALFPLSRQLPWFFPRLLSGKSCFELVASCVRVVAQF